MNTQNSFRDDILQLIKSQQAKKETLQLELENADKVIQSLQTTLKVYDEAHTEKGVQSKFIITPDELRNHATNIEQALKYIAKYSPENTVHYLIARDLILAAGLSQGKPVNVASHIHRTMAHSANWEKKEAGQFRLKEDWEIQPKQVTSYIKTVPATQEIACPVCPRSFSNYMNISRHMLAALDETHVRWIESHGLRVPVLINEGNYKALADIIEKTLTNTM